LHFTAFHPDFKLRDKPQTPPDTLHRARKIARDVGLRYVYEGNIYSDGAHTHCPQCDALLIRRSWHDVLENRLKDGFCPQCGYAIPGVWGETTLREARTRASSRVARSAKYGHLNL
jgi:pyruvate formate lyase activating enzyme